MIKRKILAIVAPVILLTSCSDFDDEWKRDEFEGARFDKIVVVGLSHEVERRKFYEQEGVKALGNKGIKAIEGLTIFPQSLTERSHNSDQVTRLIVEHKIDAVLVIKVLHEDDHSYMMPEDQVRFHSYYGRWGKNIHLHSNNYYQRPEKYFMIATLYDLEESHEENEETVVWRAANLITNPAHKFEKKKAFIVKAIDHLLDQEIIKP